MSSYINYPTLTFTEVWEDETAFSSDYDIWVPLLAGSFEPLGAERRKQAFYLLYARYGNSPIANRDVNQFKAKFFSIIFQYAPTWSQRLDIQQRLSKADLDPDKKDPLLFKGTKSIYNHAAHPASEPSTDTLEELTYIDDQNTTGYKYGPLDAYRRLWETLRVDVTEEFISKFAKLFSKFAGDRNPLIYATEEE